MALQRNQPVGIVSTDSAWTGPTVLRIRFVDKAPPGSKVIREFRHPRVAFAIEEPVELAALPDLQQDSFLADGCHIVLLSPTHSTMRLPPALAT